jgi:hypothetical protein
VNVGTVSALLGEENPWEVIATDTFNFDESQIKMKTLELYSELQIYILRI